MGNPFKLKNRGSMHLSHSHPQAARPFLAVHGLAPRPGRIGAGDGPLRNEVKKEEGRCALTSTHWQDASLALAQTDLRQRPTKRADDLAFAARKSRPRAEVYFSHHPTDCCRRPYLVEGRRLATGVVEEARHP